MPFGDWCLIDLPTVCKVGICSYRPFHCMPFGDLCHIGLRKVLKIKWSDFITMEEVREKSQQQRLTSIICLRILRWPGHTMQLPDTRLSHQTTIRKVNGQRGCRGSQMSRKHTISKDTGSLNRKWGSGWQVTLVVHGLPHASPDVEASTSE